MENENVHDITDIHERYVYLDDFRMPSDSFDYLRLPLYLQLQWTIVRNYDEFVRDTLDNGLAIVYSFDHDLADVHYKNQVFDYNDESQEKTGYHCAKWLIDYCLDNNLEVPTKILIHSMNPYGTQNIKSLFETYYKVYNKEYPKIPITPSMRR